MMHGKWITLTHLHIRHENRLVGVSGDVTATFVYDGDGRRVKATVGAANPTYYIGSHFEITNSVATKYYDAGGRRIAMNAGGTLYYLLGDHLGSISKESTLQ